jgi:hypothetical protein
MLHVFRCFLGWVGLFLMAGAGWAQGTAGYGDWQQHLPMNRPLRLADAGDRVYVVTENAFYFFDKKLNTTQVLTRRDGLNDVSVVAVAHDTVTNQTVVAYRNSNIDIIQANGRVRNLNDVARKTIQGAKEINNLSISGSKAYLSTSFGLVVIDLVKLEVSDTYSNIGPGGTGVAVYDATTANGALFVATSTGLLRGALSSNLLDFRSWTTFRPVPIPPNPGRPVYGFVTAYAGQVYASVEATGSAVYRFVPGTGGSGPGTWQPVPNTFTVQFRKLRTSSIGVFIVDDDSGVRLINQAGTVTTVVPRTPNTSTFDAVRTRDGNYYLANYQLGLQRVRPGSGQAPEVFVANGPETSLAFSILADARTNKVNVFTGGYSERYFPSGLREGFYEYANGQWTNFTAKTLPRAADFPNPLSPSRGTRTPDGTLYVGSNGGGVLEWKGPGQFRQFGQGTPAGSPLIGTFGDRNRVEVTDLTADADGKVWVVNRHLVANTSGLFILDPVATTWRTIPWVFGFEALERIALDDAGYAWVSVSRKTEPTNAPLGIFAVDPATNSPKPPRFFSTAAGLPDTQI